MTAFLKDTFTGSADTDIASHTGETGATWTEDSTWFGGQMVITDANRIRGNINALASIVRGSGTPGSADYTVTTKLRCVSAVADAYVGPVVRADGAGAGYAAVIYTPSNVVTMLEFPAVTGVGSSGAVTQTPGQDYFLALKISGSTLTAFLDGVQKATGTDSTLSAAGKAALLYYDDTDNTHGWHVDAIVAGTPSFTANVAKLGASTTGNTVTLTGVDTGWSTLGASFSIATSGSGASITGSVINSDTSATLTISAGTVGTITLTDKTTGETATIGVGAQMAVNDANLFLSPGNWYVSGSSYAMTPNTGAVLKVKFTGTSARLSVDSSNIPVGGNATLAWSIDDGDWQTGTVAPGTVQVVLGTGLSAGTHSLSLIATYVDSTHDQWVTPATALKVTGIVLDSGAASAAPTLLSGRAAFMGDSITAGIYTGVFGTANTTDGRRGWQMGVAAALGCEISNWAFGGTGWITAYATSGAPSLATTYDTIFQGQSRKVGGVYPTTFDYIFINHGNNDSGLAASDISTRLTAIRAAAGVTTKIVVVIPFTQLNKTVITTGFNNYQGATRDANCTLVDLGAIPGLTGTPGSPTVAGYDAVHPDWQTSDTLGSMVAYSVGRAFATVRRRMGVNGRNAFTT